MHVVVKKRCWERGVEWIGGIGRSTYYSAALASGLARCGRVGVWARWDLDTVQQQVLGVS